MKYKDLREFISFLESKGELRRIAVGGGVKDAGTRLICGPG